MLLLLDVLQAVADHITAHYNAALQPGGLLRDTAAASHTTTASDSDLASAAPLKQHLPYLQVQQQHTHTVQLNKALLSLTRDIGP